MSTVSSVTSSAASYPSQLAQAAALKQSLVNIGNAIQNGDMTTASNLLTAFMKDNPQYDTSSSGDSQDSINQDFQTLTTAVANKQVSAAQSAWTQVRNDLAKAGVSLATGPAATAEIVAQTKSTMDQEILSDLFGTSANSSSPTLASLLAGSSDSSSSSSTGLSSSLLSQWVTYQENGSTVPTTTADSSGSVLNTTG